MAEPLRSLVEKSNLKFVRMHLTVYFSLSVQNHSNSIKRFQLRTPQEFLPSPSGGTLAQEKLNYYLALWANSTGTWAQFIICRNGQHLRATVSRRVRPKNFHINSVQDALSSI
jgi:hypothetical protein